MVIYEVNCTINIDSFTAFYEWLIPHVQQILSYPGFERAYIAEQTDDNVAVEKKCLTVIYQLTHQKHLDHYLTHYAPQMREDGLRHFPNQFTISRRILTVKKPIKTQKKLTQYLLPQHLLSRFAGFLANNQIQWLKNYLIRYFVNRYPVNMQEAVVSDPYAYSCFNAFFTRELKPELRPIAAETNALASPVDGSIFQLGTLASDTVMQVKQHHFNCHDLLGQEQSRTEEFVGGNFATFYLAPKDYHRVHMPYPGRLRETIYIPGKLFSVNPHVIRSIPSIFSRNERLVCLFDTDHGVMAVILVGAMLVSSIHTAWSGAIQTKKVTTWCYPAHVENPVQLSKGAHLGHFQLGSTVILLFKKDMVTWANTFTENSSIKMGQVIGYV